MTKVQANAAALGVEAGDIGPRQPVMAVHDQSMSPDKAAAGAKFYEPCAAVPPGASAVRSGGLSEPRQAAVRGTVPLATIIGGNRCIAIGCICFGQHGEAGALNSHRNDSCVNRDRVGCLAHDRTSSYDLMAADAARNRPIPITV